MIQKLIPGAYHKQRPKHVHVQTSGSQEDDRSNCGCECSGVNRPLDLPYEVHGQEDHTYAGHQRFTEKVSQPSWPNRAIAPTAMTICP